MNDHPPTNAASTANTKMPPSSLATKSPNVAATSTKPPVVTVDKSAKQPAPAATTATSTPKPTMMDYAIAATRSGMSGGNDQLCQIVKHTTHTPNANDDSNKRKAAPVVATITLKQAAPVSRKPKDSLVRNRFIISLQPDGTFMITCKNCTDADGETPSYVKTWERVNVTKLREHLLKQCSGVDVAAKAVLIDASQNGKKQRLAESLIPSSNAISLGRETLANVRDGMLSDLEKRHIARTKQTSLLCPSSDGRVEKLDEAAAFKIINRRVESLVGMGLPLSTLLNPFVRSEMIAEHPAIVKHLPTTEETIFNNFVPKIDAETTAQLSQVFKTIPGQISVSFDGATILHKSMVSLLHSDINPTLLHTIY